MSESLVIGIDVGTNATKGLLCNSTGQVLAQAQQSYALLHPQHGWVEQDAEALWQAVLSVLCRLTAAAVGQGRIIALSLSSQGGTTIPVDAELRPLRPALSWLDARAAVQGERIIAAMGQEQIYRRTGWCAGAGLSLLHIPWLAENEIELFQKTRRYLFVNDFILARLCGQFYMDPADASLTMLYNIESGNWDAELCQQAQVRPEQLSPLADSGQPVGKILPEIAEASGLPADTLVVNGAHDQYCCALGAGVINDGDVLLSCGTAWVLLAAADRLLRDPQRTFSPGRHSVPGMWGVLCSMPAAGASLDWLASNLIGDAESDKPRYDLLDTKLGDRTPGAKGLLFLPYLAGMESATRQTGLWGTLTGLTLAHTRWDIAQSLMEGVALELCWLLERLQGVGYRPQWLHMTGGATRSPVWPQIVADASGVPLAISELAEAGARGAAMLAALGAGLYHTAEIAAIWHLPERIVSPRSERTARYAELFVKFKAVDAAMRGERT